jgi:AraC-like DNA-binding protein
MGLTEAVAPVFEGGRTVGYLMLGQLLRKGEREQVKERILALGNEVNSEALCRFLNAMPETDEQHLRATARILAMSAAYVRTNELLARHKETAAYKIEKHVFLHVADPALSASTVCAALGFSRTALYNACKSSFGMGIREYIQKARGEHAIHLLQKTPLPLTHVAEQVGINGTARLNRLLQAQVGLSAKEIRRRANEKPQDLTFS